VIAQAGGRAGESRAQDRPRAGGSADSGGSSPIPVDGPIRLLLGDERPGERDHRVRAMTFCLPLTGDEIRAFEARFGIPLAMVWGLTEIVVALVVPAPDASITPEEVQAFCRERLASFKVPSVVELRDALPKTSIGKIRKGELREEPRRR
jgi:acyl-CoA synthetase (AMP-forming)/AMP-acid ligase II